MKNIQKTLIEYKGHGGRCFCGGGMMLTLAFACKYLSESRVARWVCFQTKNPTLGKFWRVLQWKMLVYFMDTWSILRPFVIFYGHLVSWHIFFPFWYFVPRKIWQPCQRVVFEFHCLKMSPTGKIVVKQNHKKRREK
jgi:hypothetical protein